MATIARFDPFQDLMDRFVRGIPVEARPLPPQIKLDLADQGTAYVVTAEIPGVRKEDIHVEVDGSLVVIRAESKAEPDEKKGSRVVRTERYYGPLFRSFALDSEIDESKAEARYADGILTLTLPKKPNGKSRQLTIS